MGRSGTQGFEFKFGKNWNFNLSNFYMVGMVKFGILIWVIFIW